MKNQALLGMNGLQLSHSPVTKVQIDSATLLRDVELLLSALELQCTVRALEVPHAGTRENLHWLLLFCCCHYSCYCCCYYYYYYYSQLQQCVYRAILQLHRRGFGTALRWHLRGGRT